MSPPEEVIILINELHDHMKSIFLQEEDPELKAHKDRWGPTLKRPLPLGPKNQLPVDLFLLRSTELHEKEDDETEKFKALVLGHFNNSQNEHVYGVAHASGSGKTRLAYALGTQDAHVVLIRLTFGEAPAPAFEELLRYVQTVHLSLVEYCKQNGLDGKSSNEDITPHTRALQHYAQTALDAVRIFIFAHLEWLVCVNDQLNTLLGNDVDRQRRSWLQALGNGIGSKAVKAIFTKRVQMLQLEVPKNVVSYQNSTPAKEYCQEMHDKLRSVMLNGDQGPVIIAFDEIGAAKNLFHGLWYQFGHYLQHETFRLQELFTKLPSNSHKETADMYLAFCVIFRTLRERYSFRSILMDTSFSLFDIDDMMKRSPMRGHLVPCTSGYFHRLSAHDMYALVRRYFDVPEDMPAELKKELLVFEGRPVYFVEHPFMHFLGRCEDTKPQAPDDLIRLLINTIKEAVEKTLVFFDPIVKKAWNHKHSAEPSRRRTVSSSLADFDAVLRLDVRLEREMWLSQELVRDMSATGMIFGHEVRGSTFIHRPNREPLTFMMIRRHTDGLLENPATSLWERSDHVWRYLLEDWESSDHPMGDHYEKMVAWLFVHARMKLKTGCTLRRVLEATNLTPPGFTIPARFDHLIISATAMENMQQDPPRFNNGFLDPPTTIQYNVDKVARPDILVPLRTTSGESAVCAIQAKSGDQILTDSLCSVTPACAYLATNLKALKLLQEGSSTTQSPELLNLLSDSDKANKSEKRAAFDASVSGDLERRWLRAVCSASTYKAEDIVKVNTHNAAVEADPDRFDFVLLLSLLPRNPPPKAPLEDFVLKSWTIGQRNNTLATLSRRADPMVEMQTVFSRFNPADIARYLQSLSMSTGDPSNR